MPSSPETVRLADIQAARERIREAIYLSPLARSEMLSRRFKCHLYLKLENLQMSGAFKERGAMNMLAQLPPEQLKQGLILASAGNHAQGVAYHGGRLGAPVTVVMPSDAVLTKVSACRNFGAEVILHGETFEDALAEAHRLRAERNLTFVHPFDAPAIIAGQGTIGLEVLEQCPQVDTVVVPIGGGGLISGIATALKGIKPDARVVGVEAAAMPAANKARAAGTPVTIPSAHSIADGICVQRVGEHTFPIIEALVDDLVTVAEDEIAAAVLTLLEDEKTVAEGAGAAALAAVMHGKVDVADRHVVVIVSGGNIDVGLISNIIEMGELKSGRLLQLQIRLRDQPGELVRISTIFADRRANVVQIHHSRSVEGLRLGEALVDVELETRDFDHIDEIKEALTAAGYHVNGASTRGG